MSTDLTPERSARPLGSPGFPEVEAAYRYVDSVVQHADAISPCGGHAWHGWALREAFLAGCTHDRDTGSHVTPILEEVAASPYAIELDETTGQVLTCPECSSTSIGFSTHLFGIATRKETRGPVNVDIITLSFRCEDCGEQWQLQMESCRGRQGQALSVALEINPKPPSLEVAEQPERLSSATETLGQHLDELADEAFKRGSITTLKTLETALKREWVVRLAFRIWPMIVLRKFRERIEEAPPLPAQASSEGLPADHSSELYPLG